MQKTTTNQPFSLARTLEAGQFFRWRKQENNYYAQTRDVVLKLRQEGNKLHYACSITVAPAFVKKFLGLGHDLQAIYQKIDKDPAMHAAIKKFKGMRVMRQEPFECLISYICSANSNIPNIQRMAENLSRTFGKKIRFDNQTFYSFPSPKALACARTSVLRECKLGFRAPYVKAAAKAAAEGRISWNREGLMRLKGVGPKIADCVRLYGLNDFSAFPTDVWMRRAMKKYYGCEPKDVQEFAAKRFGKHAGYAQLYLFNLVRDQR